MSLTAVTPCPSPATVWAILLTLIWSFIVPALLRNPSRWSTAAPLAAALVPVALNVMNAWFGVVRCIESMAISGNGSGGAVAAGLAEVHFHAIFGLGASVVAITILLVIAFRHRREESSVAPRFRSFTRIGGIAIAIAAALILITSRLLADGPTVTAWYFARTMAFVMLSIVAVLIVFAFLRYAQSPSWRWNRRALAIAFAAEIVLAVPLWIELKHLEHIAMFG